MAIASMQTESPLAGGGTKTSTTGGGRVDACSLLTTGEVAAAGVAGAKPVPGKAATGGVNCNFLAKGPGLPKGVTASALTIAPAMTQGLVVLSAAADAPRDAANVQVSGTSLRKGSDGKEETLVRTATPVRVASVYVPHGRTVEHWHYEYKSLLLDALAAQCPQWLRDGAHLIGRRHQRRGHRQRRAPSRPVCRSDTRDTSRASGTAPPSRARPGPRADRIRSACRQTW